MTCKDIFDLYASDTEKSDLCDAYRKILPMRIYKDVILAKDSTILRN